MQIYGRTDSRKLAFGWLSCHISIGRKPDMSKKTRSGSLRMGMAGTMNRSKKTRSGSLRMGKAGTMNRSKKTRSGSLRMGKAGTMNRSKKTRSGSLRMGKAEVQIRYRGMVQTVPLFFSKRRRRREFLEQVI